ncbi:calcium-binding protein [Pseudoalteromonas sp. JBTF-M23]|uniref:Calcium-binding protein n=1 Tax=Pseudoalteromonas caenipelagi TaxID=2726988 RepID=A0A849VG25_9GAMM|nr:calcium-binding protein [Pseudoalteromonas caenipelagi]NOU51463.1 calcium-binding protein [Pseudoalteromonas caenipelagi]
MAFKLNSLCLALSLGASNYVMASCGGIGDGASAYISGTTLLIKGSSASETFTLTSSGDDLTVTRKQGNSSSCDLFQLSQLSNIKATLGNGNDNYDGSQVSLTQQIYGDAGNDNINSGSKNDLLYGGAGDDTLSGQGGNDQLHGESGKDILSGGNGDDILKGGDDHDKLFGDGNNDTLFGENGGDLLMGGQGTDILFGGNDNDYLGGGCRLSNAGNSYIYQLSSCNSNNDGGDTLYGGNGHDVLSGGEGNDKLYGEDGNDYLTGNGGREDRLYGGDGDDALLEAGDASVNSIKWHKAWGNGGDDLMFVYGEDSDQEGGSGNDVIITSSTQYDAKIDGGKNGDYIWSADSAPQGTCGKGDDKGMVFLNSCENVTWVKDYQGLLSKVDKKSNYDNPYYDAANSVVELSSPHNGYDKGWRSFGSRPYALFDIVSSVVFNRWLDDQTTTPYSYHEWKVTIHIGSGIYGTYTNCMEDNFSYKCKYLIQQNQICYDKSGDTVDCG